MNKLIITNTLDSTSRTIIICAMIFNILYSLFELFRYPLDSFGFIIFLITLIPTIVLGGIMTMKSGLVEKRGKVMKASFLFGKTIDTTTIDDHTYKTVGSIELIRQQKGNSTQHSSVKEIIYDVSLFKETPSEHKRLFTSTSSYKVQTAIDFITSYSYLKPYEIK